MGMLALIALHVVLGGSRLPPERSHWWAARAGGFTGGRARSFS